MRQSAVLKGRGFEPRRWPRTPDLGALAPEVTGGGRGDRLPKFFDSLIATLWRFQSCATTESTKSYVKRGSAPVKTCNLAPASTNRRIIAEYVAANITPSE
jgi:hypothetical protein